MTSIHTVEFGLKNGPAVVFAHGWGRAHDAFMPIAELVAPFAHVVLLDLPGFGQSPRPDACWGSDDYATHIKEYLANNHQLSRFIWVGHSYGGRVGMQLAAQTNTPIEQLVVVAGSGVKAPTPFLKKLKNKRRSRAFKKAKARAANEQELITIEKAFGSTDYVHSREIGMRDIFVNAVQEDLSDVVKNITCPTTLIYGTKDTEASPATGKIFHTLIPHSTYLECPEFDHDTLLTRGRHQVTLMIKEHLLGQSA